MKKPLSMFIFFLVVTPVQSAEAPFGVNWGESKSAIERKGITLENSDRKGSIAAFKTKQLPKNLSIAEQYVLYIDNEYQLQKIIMVSKDIDEDLYGSKGKETFSDLKSKLTQKYGNPTNELERVGMTLYKENNGFYQCLAYEGCGMWVAIYKDQKEDVGILLELKGMKRGTGYIKITYEGPNWSKIIDKMKKNNSESDAGTL